MSEHTAENDATRVAREAGLPHCPACGDMAHLPDECQCQNLALGRCVCPAPGFERGMPSYLAPPGSDRAGGGPMSEIVHTYPVNDVVEHATDGGDCICGPTTEAVFRDDGSNGWHVTHHSLDGREAMEDEQ